MSAKKQPVALMYHAITSPGSSIPQDREAGAELYDVPLAEFKKHALCLKEGGYEVTTAESLNLSERVDVIMTFDDGEMNNFHNAFPVLREFRFPAYFFATVDRIGKKGYMGWEELRELRDANMVVGSHGLTHAILTNLKDKQIEKELADSRDTLEHNLKINVESFSVPRGFYNERVITLARKAGYRHIFVSGPPQAHAQNCIGRTAIKSDWSLNRFKQALHHEVPVVEAIGNSLKSSAKGVLGGHFYDSLRRILLKKTQS